LEVKSKMKNMKLERAELMPTRIWLTATHDNGSLMPDPDVNVMHLNAEDVEPLLTEAVVVLADHMGIPPQSLLKQVAGQVRRRVWIRRIMGRGLDRQEEDARGQVIQLQVIGGRS
jgi:hypothetical protein